jgi:DNA relaxase NicK
LYEDIGLRGRFFMRFYDKAAQMGTPLPWNRAEIELKDKRALIAVVLLINNKSIGELFVGVMNEYLAVINLDDSNTSRCTIQPWWSDWLQSTEKIKLTTAKAIKGVEESMEYVKKQYAPTFAMIKEHLGITAYNEFIRDMAKTGKDRMSMKHEQMLFLSAQRKADNYDQDRDEFEERAAIMEFDGGLDRQEAEAAARLQLDQEDQT